MPFDEGFRGLAGAALLPLACSSFRIPSASVLDVGENLSVSEHADRPLVRKEMARDVVQRDDPTINAYPISMACLSSLLTKARQ